ncbi:hypothetical protein RchiOBHm_Chr7g0205381 [Rosa chinensis]|uniref:Uncharacterized protein n=1 Tax=Rosa chinensis TaxID=74649 RepID=A0A2P6P8Y4_ROSCH|nr:hypothetical protein RchiOBHm_Chr7g0205381 [Rosa chinensis]
MVSVEFENEDFCLFFRRFSVLGLIKRLLVFQFGALFVLGASGPTKEFIFGRFWLLELLNYVGCIVVYF